MLFTVAQTEKVSQVYESGTANGFSTLWLAAALRQQGLGPVSSELIRRGGEETTRVHTFDPVDRKKLWTARPYGTLAPYITYHQEPFDEGIYKLPLEHRGLTPALFFIDGDHNYHGMKKDVQAMLNAVSPGDVIVFHDLKDYQNIRDRFDELAKENRSAIIYTDRVMGIIWYG